MFHPERTLIKDVRLFKLAILLASAMGVMTDAVVTPALPAVKAHFGHIDNMDMLVRLFLTMPALFVAIGSPIAGFIVDRFGRKPYLLISAVLIGVGGCVGLLTESFTVLLISRAVVGFAIAGTATSLGALVSDYFDGEERANLFGLQAAFIGIGGTTFLTFGGMLADISWNAPFWLYLYPFILLPFLMMVIVEPPRPSIHLPLGETPSVRPMFPLQLMTFVYGLCFTGQLMGYNVSAQVPFYLESLSSLSMGQIGMALSANAIAFSIGSLSAGWYYKRFSPLMVIAIAFPILSAAAFAIAAATSWHLVAVGLVLNGYGFGMWMPNMSAWLANNAHETVRGRILGGLTTSVLLGQFVAPLLSQPFVTMAGVPTLFAISSVIWMGLGVAVYIYRANLMRWTSRHALIPAAA